MIILISVISVEFSLILQPKCCAMHNWVNKILLVHLSATSRSSLRLQCLVSDIVYTISDKYSKQLFLLLVCLL